MATVPVMPVRYTPPQETRPAYRLTFTAWAVPICLFFWHTVGNNNVRRVRGSCHNECKYRPSSAYRAPLYFLPCRVP